MGKTEDAGGDAASGARGQTERSTAPRTALHKGSRPPEDLWVAPGLPSASASILTRRPGFLPTV